MNHFIYYLLPIIGWSIPTFFVKKLREIFNSIEIIILLHFITHIFILSFILILYFKNNKRINIFVEKIKNIKSLSLCMAFLISILILGSQYGFNTILKYNDVTYSLPIIRALSSILLVILGYFIFKENVTLKKFIGIISSIIGIYLITSS